MYLICKEQLCLQHINNDIRWFLATVYMYLIIIWANNNDYECEHELKTSTDCNYFQNLSNSSHSTNSLLITEIYETITVSYITSPYMHWPCLLMLCVSARQTKNVSNSLKRLYFVVKHFSVYVTSNITKINF